MQGAVHLREGSGSLSIFPVSGATSPQSEYSPQPKHPASCDRSSAAHLESELGELLHAAPTTTCIELCTFSHPRLSLLHLYRRTGASRALCRQNRLRFRLSRHRTMDPRFLNV